MGLLYQGFSFGAGHARDGDFQGGFDAETVRDLADANAAVDGYFAGKVDLLSARDEFDRAHETGRIAGGKKLLGAGASHRPAPPSSRGVASFTSNTPSEDTALPSRPPVAFA